MPKQQLPDSTSFESFTRSLLGRGFRKLTRTEFRSDFRRLALRAPSPREGRETGFVFSANGLKVIVWTTFVESEGQAREKDAGWVLIKSGDKVRYFSRPYHRTKNFLYHLLWSACIARVRVLQRPLCPVCQARMNITYGKGTKARYWKCDNRDHHLDSKPINLPWDIGLPQEALNYLERQRKVRRKYRTKLSKQGKSSESALERRVGWRAGNLQNVVPAR